MNKNMVMGPIRARNQKWLCWRGPTAHYCYALLSLQMSVTYRHTVWCKHSIICAMLQESGWSVYFTTTSQCSLTNLTWALSSNCCRWYSLQGEAIFIKSINLKKTPEHKTNVVVAERKGMMSLISKSDTGHDSASKTYFQTTHPNIILPSSSSPFKRLFPKRFN
jgi:hypothetical protein